jgi:hypothetical protein
MPLSESEMPKPDRQYEGAAPKEYENGRRTGGGAQKRRHGDSICYGQVGLSV